MLTLLEKILECVPNLPRHRKEAEAIAWANHKRIAALYDWHTVARKTEQAYASALEAAKARKGPHELFQRYREKLGLVWGPIFILWFVIDYIILMITNLVSRSN